MRRRALGATSPQPDLAELRRRVATARGPELWRCLEELSGSPAFQELAEREFPELLPEGGGTDRRTFLELAAASMAMAGLAACTRQPAEPIVPWVEQPEQVIPGKPLRFATAMTLGGYATGILVESHLGRPTKVEGNPDHPASLGGTDVFGQASILDLYDPDRSQTPRLLGRITSWSRFRTELAEIAARHDETSGRGLRLLTGAVTSPTLGAALDAVLERFPEARWHHYEPVHRDAARSAASRAFGRPAEVHYDLGRAEVILALDADLFALGPGRLRYARDFARGRRIDADPEARMNRLWAVEPTPSLTGGMADHRLPLGPWEIASFALALAGELGVPGFEAGGAKLPEEARRWLPFLAADLRDHAGRSLVAVGDAAAPELQLLGLVLNQALGNLGETVRVTEPIETRPVSQSDSLAELVADMTAGRVETLLVLGRNPVYEAPGDLPMVDAMLEVPLRIHLGLYADETSEYCDWHLPQAHFLEAWGDALAYDGTATIVQPLIEPLYGGRSALEVLSWLVGESATPYEQVRSLWQRRYTGSEFESWWRQALHDGVVPGSAAPPLDLEVDPAASEIAAARQALDRPSRGGEDGLGLVFRPDPTVYDGSFANNGWLQETPKPFTLLTWDNALLVSPGDAEELGLASDELVEVRAGESSVTAPVFVLPGQARGVVTVHLGYDRRRAGRVGEGAGFDAYRLRRIDSPWYDGRVSLEPRVGLYPLATTQAHHAIPLASAEAQKRHLVRSGTLTLYREDPAFARHLGHAVPGHSLYPAWDYEGYSWGMTVDLGACLGCNACVVACQAENNVPVVGKEEVLRGREMHWLRIDRYFAGDLDHPDVHHQPVLCMHCELAPCEVVCPVNATVHGDEGLNEMIYNRCVGTRYCSNNCPYKVRRFNFHHYAAIDAPVLELARNPDVTVRTRGVMEKCTYCVQRINAARIEAKKEGRQIRDGEVRTACQQACPTEAIVFGDLNDSDSAVAAAKARPRNYTLLEELGTRPRTSYLAKITNPHPALAPATDPGSEGHG